MCGCFVDRSSFDVDRLFMVCMGVVCAMVNGARIVSVMQKETRIVPRTSYRNYRFMMQILDCTSTYVWITSNVRLTRSCTYRKRERADH